MRGGEAEGGSAGHGAPGEWTGYPDCGPVRGGPERKGQPLEVQMDPCELVVERIGARTLFHSCDEVSRPPRRGGGGEMATSAGRVARGGTDRV